MRILIVVVVLTAIGAALGYRFGIPLPLRAPAIPHTADDAEPALELPAEGARFTLAQRTDAEIPGSGGRLSVYIGDITRKQVDLTVSHRDGRVLVPSRSVREGDRIEFKIGDTRYHVAVLALQNHLVGTDSAVLEITAGHSERDRIELLLHAMEESDLVFIRNGTEYAGAKAAEHLRRKWEAGGDRIRTAEQFIEHLASRSSISGRAYEVRLPDGTTMSAGTWLTEQLRAPNDE